MHFLQEYSFYKQNFPQTKVFYVTCQEYQKQIKGLRSYERIMMVKNRLNTFHVANDTKSSARSHQPQEDAPRCSFLPASVVALQESPPASAELNVSASSVLHEAAGIQVNGDVHTGRTLLLSQFITVPSLWIKIFS